MNQIQPDTTSEPAMKPQSRQRSRVVTWLIRIVAALAALVILVTACGLVYQAVGEANDARAYPPPGQMVTVNGLNLHLYCTGAGSPTVILEAMASNNSTEWGWIQPEIAKTTRVCAYDRAGAGWSDSPATARTAEQTVLDLDELLASANVPPPYVFVGHSIGGILARMYAARYPEKVTGMVLVDSSHPEQMVRYPALRAGMQDYAQQAAAFPWLARLGLFRLFFASGEELDFGALAPRQRAELKAMWSAPKYHESALRDLPAAFALYDHPPAPGALGDRPLIVLTAGENQLEGWMTLQQELAKLSTNATHQVVQGASHGSLAFDPEHAHQVTEGIQAVVAAVRATSN